jgi:hypothetical protein
VCRRDRARGHGLRPSRRGGRPHVANFRIILPTVPKSAEDLDEVRRVIEEIGDRGEIPRDLVGSRVGDPTPSEQASLECAGRHPGLESRSALADIVEGGNRLGDVKRLCMRGGGHRNDAYRRGCGRHARRHEGGIESPPDLIVPLVEEAPPTRLHPYGVIDVTKSSNPASTSRTRSTQ